MVAEYVDESCIDLVIDKKKYVRNFRIDMSNQPEPNNRAPVGRWDARSDKDDSVLTFALPLFDQLLLPARRWRFR
jgi:hypothetical protein